MANYYVSKTTGNDSTGNGTSPATAWATIGKAIGSSPAITLSGSGDTLWIEPGVYREVVTLGLSPTSGGPLAIKGDGDGAGFAAGGGAGTTGTVVWTGWSNTTTPIATSEVLVSSGKSYVTLQGIKFIGSSSGSTPSCLNISGTWSNWTIQDCVFMASLPRPYIAWIAGATGAALNLTIQRCEFWSGGSGFCIDIRMPVNASAEYNINALVLNCKFVTASGAVRLVNVGGSGSFYPTGLAVQNCTAWSMASSAFSVAFGAGVALTTPSTVYGCAVYNSVGGLSAGQSTQLVEDGNILYATTARSGVSTGANSVAVAEPAFEIGETRISGMLPRPFFEPSLVSPMLAFGNYGTTPTTDLYNQTRPATASSGALERDVFSTGSTTYIFQTEG